MNSSTKLPVTTELFARPALGEVMKTISLDQRGRVKFEATYWFARFYSSHSQDRAEPGTLVSVIGREGLTLLIKNKTADFIQ